MRVVTDADLSAVAALGEFFDLSRPAPAGALTLSGFASDPDAVRTEVARTAAVLGVDAERAEDVRAAASVVHLGLVARIVAPVVGARALLGSVPFACADLRLHWVSRSMVLTAGEDGEPDDVVATLALLGAAFADVGSLSSLVLWGNAGSAVASAAMLVAAARPAAGAAARAAAEDLLAHPDLSGTGAYVGGAWRRTSCCLYYRIPGGGLCGDCVLAERPPAQP